MHDGSMLISTVLIMIAGAAGNAAIITISHLLYHYQALHIALPQDVLGHLEYT